MKDYRKTALYKKLTPYLATVYAEQVLEGENATDEERLTAFQYLIDEDMIRKLQGWYGRTADALFNKGLLLPPKQKKK